MPPSVLDPTHIYYIIYNIYSAHSQGKKGGVGVNL